MALHGVSETGASALPVETAAVVIERLEQERRRCQGHVILATDADGTLWTGDVGVEVFMAALDAGAIREATREALVAEARLFGVAPTGTPTEIARALTTAWEDGRVPHERAFALHAWGFAGWSAPELDALIIQVFGAFEARRRRELDPIFAWARGAGVDVWVVSASPEAPVRRGVGGLVPTERVLAMAPAWDGAVVAPRLAAPPVFGPGKVSALERAVPGAVLLGAFGDAGGDVPMLARARVPIAIDPKPSLLDAAASIPGLVVLAP